MRDRSGLGGGLRRLGVALQRRALWLFGLLPGALQLRMARLAGPSYLAGAIVVLEDADGRLLLVRQSYRNGWGLPGGLLDAGEEPAAAASREVREEIGLLLQLDAPPRVVMDTATRQIHFVFRVTQSEETELRPCSPEIVEVGWFEPDALPALQDETVALFEALRGGASFSCIAATGGRRHDVSGVER